MALPPDEPTRPLHPAAGPPPDPVYREVPVAADDAAFRAEVIDSLRGLRTFVFLATILSVLALALAAWALFVEDDNGDGNGGNGARAAQVQALEQRVAKLEAQPDQKGVAPADFNALADDQANLDAQVKDLSAQVEALSGQVDDLAAQSDAQATPATTEDTEARASIETLDQSVSDLDKRVQALEQQAP